MPLLLISLFTNIHIHIHSITHSYAYSISMFPWNVKQYTVSQRISQQFFYISMAIILNIVYKRVSSYLSTKNAYYPYIICINLLKT